MKSIKTKEAAKTSIRTMEKNGNPLKHVKRASVTTKEHLKQEVEANDKEHSGQEYATQRIETKGRNAVSHVRQEITYRGKEGAKRTFQRNRESTTLHKKSIKSENSFIPKGTKIENALIQKGTRNGKPLIKGNVRSVKQVVGKGRRVNVGKQRVLIKSSKTSIKSMKATAQGSKVAVKAAVKNSQRAYHIAKLTTKSMVVGVKAATKATVATVKAIILALKSLISAIVAGGWVAILVIILVCLIGALVNSTYGIFFSGEDIGEGQTMQSVITEINQEYEDELNAIKSSTPHDVLEMSGSRAVWKEVLAVYSVKVNTDAAEPMEVATINEKKKELLLRIFWDMHTIDTKTEVKTETIFTESADEVGNIVEEETQISRTYLYVTVTNKTVEEMISFYGFNEAQQTVLLDLLNEKHDELWASVLYGVQGSDGEIVSIALSQVGNVGGQPYWSWYGFGSRVEWCATFVSWCANEAGYIEAGVIPKFASCRLGSMWFKERGQWGDRFLEPASGSIIFFDWTGDGSTEHVGIVEKCEGGYVYTIEGNSGDACRTRRYPVGSYQIYGYGLPAY